MSGPNSWIRAFELSQVQVIPVRADMEVFDPKTAHLGSSHSPSVVRHSERRLCRAWRARLTFSKVSEARAVQMKGLGFSL